MFYVYLGVTLSGHSGAFMDLKVFKFLSCMPFHMRVHLLAHLSSCLSIYLSIYIYIYISLIYVYTHKNPKHENLKPQIMQLKLSPSESEATSLQPQAVEKRAEMVKGSTPQNE